MSPTLPRALTLALLVSAGAARADAASPCYARSYEAAHLGAHPRQRVEAVWLALSREPAPADVGNASVWDLTVRIGTETFNGSAVCRGGICLVEGDGGGFSLRPVGRTLELRVGARLALEGDHSFSPDLGQSADDRVFRLDPAPAARCAALRP